MQNFIISLCLCFLPLVISAQSLERTVLASAGNEAESSELHLSYTVGEALIETLEHPVLHLTQGFQQSKLEIVMSAVDAELQLEAKVFPNPAQSEIHILFQSEQFTDWTLRVFDHKGKSMHQENFLIGELQKVINCGNWPVGMYYLQLIEKVGEVKTVKVEKMK